MRDKYCLTSAISFKNLNQSAVNRSPTKQTFSFGKSTRFLPPASICPKNTYGGEFYQRSQQGYAIGRSARTDFTKCLAASPLANKYSLASFLDESKMRRRGYTFSLGRENIQHNSYISKEAALPPPSTKYNTGRFDNLSNSKQEPAYSMRRKTVLNDKRLTLECQNSNPGPGTYLQLNPQKGGTARSSLNITSKFKKTVSHTLTKSRRFDPSATLVPGPGSYQQKNSLSKNGMYVVSKFHGGTMAKFNSSAKMSSFDAMVQKNKGPGPGCYRIPSEFGQYDGDVYEFQAKTERKG